MNLDNRLRVRALLRAWEDGDSPIPAIEAMIDAGERDEAIVLARASLERAADDDRARLVTILDPLSIERARLIHRSSQALEKFDAALLRELLARQGRRGDRTRAHALIGRDGPLRRVAPTIPKQFALGVTP